MYATGLTVRHLQMSERDYKGSEQYARAKRAQVTLNEMWARAGDRIATWCSTPCTPAGPTRPASRRRCPRSASSPGRCCARSRRAPTRWCGSPPTTPGSRAPAASGTTGGAARSTSCPRPAKVDTTERRADLWSWCVEQHRCGDPVIAAPTRRERIAVVGSGIAGLTCAHVLGPHHDVVLFEADHRLGGHSNTVDVDDPTAGTVAVDTGFIVHNDRNYPNLVRLFTELGVPTVDTEMSFAVTDRDPSSPTHGLTYRATSPNTLFADRRNLVRPAMWRMLRDITRFYREANAFLADPDDRVSLADFLGDRPLLARVPRPAPAPDGRRRLVGRPGDVRRVPRPEPAHLPLEPRAARRPRPTAVAVDPRRQPRVRAGDGRPLRRRDPARRPGAAHRASRRRRRPPGRRGHPPRPRDVRPGGARGAQRSGAADARRADARRARRAGQRPLPAQPGHAPHRRVAAVASPRARGRRGTTTAGPASRWAERRRSPTT